MKKVWDWLKVRAQSWALWLAFAAMGVWIWKEATGTDISEKVREFMDLLLPLLVAFGIVNNPTDREHW